MLELEIRHCGWFWRFRLNQFPILLNLTIWPRTSYGYQWKTTRLIIWPWKYWYKKGNGKYPVNLTNKTVTNPITEKSDDTNNIYYSTPTSVVMQKTWEQTLKLYYEQSGAYSKWPREEHNGNNGKPSNS